MPFRSVISQEIRLYWQKENVRWKNKVFFIKYSHHFDELQQKPDVTGTVHWKVSYLIQTSNNMQCEFLNYLSNWESYQYMHSDTFYLEIVS